MPDFTLACPIPISDYPTVQLAHGGGGRLMHQLIGKMFAPLFTNPLLAQEHDGAVFNVAGGRLAMSTDSFVVRPLFFPGGNIGSLAVHGTVNDLAMCGARPRYLSASFVLEEGLPMTDLWRIVQSMAVAANEAGVQIITGDTKVVDRGKGDGIYINTSGVGIVEHDRVIGPMSVQPGDAVIINGDLGRHGIAIMAVREGLAFESAIESDSACVAGLVMDMLDADIDIHCLRDMTRGGLASSLVEIAQTSKQRIHIDERRIPVRQDVRGACEILGLDPLYVANEGRFVAFVPAAEAERCLAAMQAHPLGQGAALIGHVAEEKDGLVTMRSAIGASRIVDMLSGEQLPRIC
ncbi:hydrogenase expression/formation protein HypE [bacterium]|nr:hydrogenase expression/formation protein HypE [bacterium]